MRHGTIPLPVDHRDYSFERTFGAVSLAKLPDEYDCDLGLTMPDQEADGFPNGCTGYTQTEVAQDEDGLLYDPAFTYAETLLMQDLPPNSPCNIRTSLESTRVYGLKHGTEDPGMHRTGQYFDVDKVGDYFDGFRNALWLNRLNKRPISLGSPWPWNPDQTGVLKGFMWNQGTPWHNYKCAGWVLKNGVLYLKLKPWQGKGYGDNGWVYMSRELCNQVFDVTGTAAYTRAKAQPEDIVRIKLSIYQTVLSYYLRLLTKLWPS